MPSDNVIHIKLEYEEAINSKKNLLSAEMNSLKIAKIIGRYRELRLLEFEIKSRIYTKMKEIKANIKRLQALLPEPKRPRILKKGHIEEAQPTAKGEYYSEDIEAQLKEIQRRLDELQRGSN